LPGLFTGWSSTRFIALVTDDSVPLPKATLVELRDVLRLIESLSLARPKGTYTQS